MNPQSTGVNGTSPSGNGVWNYAPARTAETSTASPHFFDHVEPSHHANIATNSVRISSQLVVIEPGGGGFSLMLGFVPVGLSTLTVEVDVVLGVVEEPGAGANVGRGSAVVVVCVSVGLGAIIGDCICCDISCSIGRSVSSLVQAINNIATSAANPSTTPTLSIYPL